MPVKDVKEIVDLLKSEGQVIRQAPYSFCLCVLILGVLIFLVIGSLYQWHFSGIISQEDATIETLKEQRDNPDGKFHQIITADKPQPASVLPKAISDSENQENQTLNTNRFAKTILISPIFSIDKASNDIARPVIFDPQQARLFADEPIHLNTSIGNNKYESTIGLLVFDSDHLTGFNIAGPPCTETAECLDWGGARIPIPNLISIRPYIVTVSTSAEVKNDDVLISLVR
jgi:hypothetical protein